MDAPLLEIDNLRVDFHTPTGIVHAVRGLSFSLGRERLGIVGESGSGKSVTALSLMRLLEEPARIVGGEMAWPLVLVGIAMGITLILVRVKSPMLFSVGMYLPLETTFRSIGRGTELDLRWLYLHMIEEYARHNGHADLLRERIDGQTGD